MRNSCKQSNSVKSKVITEKNDLVKFTFRQRSKKNKKNKNLYEIICILFIIRKQPQSGEKYHRK